MFAALQFRLPGTQQDWSVGGMVFLLLVVFGVLLFSFAVRKLRFFKCRVYDKISSLFIMKHDVPYRLVSRSVADSVAVQVKVMMKEKFYLSFFI